MGLAYNVLIAEDRKARFYKGLLATQLSNPLNLNFIRPSHLAAVSSYVRTMAIRVAFYYDCLSPFSYLAFSVLRRYRAFWNLDLVLRPIILGGVMAGTGNLPPAARQWSGSTAKWSGEDLERNKAFFNVPLLDFPSNFFGPGGPADKAGLARNMSYQRLLTLISLREGPAGLENASSACFDAIWVRTRCVPRRRKGENGGCEGSLAGWGAGWHRVGEYICRERSSILYPSTHLTLSMQRNGSVWCSMRAACVCDGEKEK